MVDGVGDNDFWEGSKLRAHVIWAIKEGGPVYYRFHLVANNAPFPESATLPFIFCLLVNHHPSNKIRLIFIKSLSYQMGRVHCFHSCCGQGLPLCEPGVGRVMS